MFSNRGPTSRALTSSVSYAPSLAPMHRNSYPQRSVNQHTYSRRASAALILSPDVMAAALVGAAVELAGLRAEFARSGETLKDALARIRASHVLIDCDDPLARDETMLGPALMTGARLFYFGAATRVNAERDLAARFQARLIALPDDVERLRDILTRRPSPTRERSHAD
jgi:hypothetical protein